MAKVGKITLDSQPDEYILRPHRLNYIVMEDGEVHSIWDTQEQADNTILELIHNEGQFKCVIKESNRIPLNPYDIRHRSSSSEDCRGSISSSSSNSSSSSSSSIPPTDHHHIKPAAFLLHEFTSEELEVIYAEYLPMLEGLTNIEKEDKLVELVSLGILSADKALAVAIRAGLILES